MKGKFGAYKRGGDKGESSCRAQVLQHNEGDIFILLCGVLS